MAHIALWSPGRDVVRLPIESYPDGSPRIVGVPPWPFDSLLLQSASLADLMAALFFVDADAWRFRGQYRGLKRLVLPCVPCARQDRPTPEGDALQSLRSVASEINRRSFREVVVVDPHSAATATMIHRCTVLEIDAILSQTDPPADMVIAPDAGAAQRAGRVARSLQVPLIHAWKRRDAATGRLDGFGYDLPGLRAAAPSDGTRRTAVMVDDLCDGGGTFVGLAEEIRRGFPREVLRLELFATHGLFTKGTAGLRKVFDAVGTTDTVVGAPREGVREIPICERILTATATEDACTPA